MARTFNKILVPTDFSEPSHAALNCARELVQAFGGSLHVIHVLEDSELRGVVGEGYIGPSPTLPQREGLMEQAARDQLERLFDETDRKRLDTHLGVVTGDPVHEILWYAQQHDIDLVVMGTHGRTGIAHVLLGSVAEHVVRKSVCPVLTMHGVRQPVAARLA